jgi:hypothetical protein
MSTSLQGNLRSPARARRRSRSPPPQRELPRGDWTKSLSASPPGQPLNKRRNTRSSKPSSPGMASPSPLPEATLPRPEVRGSQQLQAAPLEGAGPKAR